MLTLLLFDIRCGRTYGDVYAGWPLLCCCLVYIMLVTEVAPFLMRGRADLPLAYLFGVLWGSGMAFYYSLLKSIYFFIIPGGQEVKFSGLFALFQVILSWLVWFGWFVCMFSHAHTPVFCFVIVPGDSELGPASRFQYCLRTGPMMRDYPPSPSPNHSTLTLPHSPLLFF